MYNTNCCQNNHKNKSLSPIAMTAKVIMGTSLGVQVLICVVGINMNLFLPKHQPSSRSVCCMGGRQNQGTDFPEINEKQTNKI